MYVRTYVCMYACMWPIDTESHITIHSGLQSWLGITTPDEPGIHQGNVDQTGTPNMVVERTKHVRQPFCWSQNQNFPRNWNWFPIHAWNLCCRNSLNFQIPTGSCSQILAPSEPLISINYCSLQKNIAYVTYVLTKKISRSLSFPTKIRPVQQPSTEIVATSCLQLDPASRSSRQLSTVSAAPGTECRAPRDRCWIPGAMVQKYGLGPENVKKIGKPPNIPNSSGWEHLKPSVSMNRYQ